MRENRKRKLISLLLIAFFVFQLIPSTVTNVGGLESHAQNSSVVFSPSASHHDLLLTGRANVKTPSLKIPVKYALMHAHQTPVFSISLTSSYLEEVPFDYRRVIQQSIPHYFNGSKYKNNYFAI